MTTPTPHTEGDELEAIIVELFQGGDLMKDMAPHVREHAIKRQMAHPPLAKAKAALLAWRDKAVAEELRAVDNYKPTVYKSLWDYIRDRIAELEGKR